MKKNNTPLLDEHLKSLANMHEAGTDASFYTRLRAKMESRLTHRGPSLPIKPAWVICTLALLLMMNAFMLVNQFGGQKTKSSTSSPLQNFAESYDQSIQSY